MIGFTGRVTGRIGPGLVGEVIISIRGGSEAFNAFAYVTGETIEPGTVVKVDEYHEPRTVYVSPARV